MSTFRSKLVTHDTLSQLPHPKALRLQQASKYTLDIPVIIVNVKSWPNKEEEGKINGASLLITDLTKTHHQTCVQKKTLPPKINEIMQSMTVWNRNTIFSVEMSAEQYESFKNDVEDYGCVDPMFARLNFDLRLKNGTAIDGLCNSIKLPSRVMPHSHSRSHSHSPSDSGSDLHRERKDFTQVMCGIEQEFVNLLDRYLKVRGSADFDKMVEFFKLRDFIHKFGALSQDIEHISQFPGFLESVSMDETQALMEVEFSDVEEEKKIPGMSEGNEIDVVEKENVNFGTHGHKKKVDVSNKILEIERELDSGTVNQRLEQGYDYNGGDNDNNRNGFEFNGNSSEKRANGMFMKIKPKPTHNILKQVGGSKGHANVESQIPEVDGDMGFSDLDDDLDVQNVLMDNTPSPPPPLLPSLDQIESNENSISTNNNNINNINNNNNIDNNNKSSTSNFSNANNQDFSNSMVHRKRKGEINKEIEEHDDNNEEMAILRKKPAVFKANEVAKQQLQLLLAPTLTLTLTHKQTLQLDKDLLHFADNEISPVHVRLDSSQTIQFVSINKLNRYVDNHSSSSLISNAMLGPVRTLGILPFKQFILTPYDEDGIRFAPVRIMFDDEQESEILVHLQKDTEFHHFFGLKGGNNDITNGDEDFVNVMYSKLHSFLQSETQMTIKIRQEYEYWQCGAKSRYWTFQSTLDELLNELTNNVSDE